MCRPDYANENARVETGRQEETVDEANVKANSYTLATEADRIAATVPYLLTREAMRSAVGEFLAIWLQILRGECGGCGGR